MLLSVSQPSRHVFTISATVLLLVGGLGRTAAAKDCTTDSDCDTGYQCVFAQASDGTAGAGGSTASSGAGAVTGSTCPVGVNCGTSSSSSTEAPVPAMDAGAAPLFVGADAGLSLAGPVPTGICQPKPIVCTTVADCPSVDFDCVMDMIPTIAPACPAGTKCEPPQQTSTTGTCVAKPHACSTAADCPAPLTCQAEQGTCSGGASVAPDGTVTAVPGTCTPGPSVCTWLPVTCATDSDCADPLYQCVKVSESGWCSGSGGTCAAGETCPSPPTCGSTAVMNCMPKPMNCACGPCPAGAMCGACLTCPAGWSCFDFSNYNGGVRPIWSPNAPDKSCLPDGIILATEGHASDGGQFAENSGGGGSGSTPPAVNPVSPTRNSAAGSAGGEDAATVHSSGCAYGASEAGPISLWLALAMAGMVARLARRRTRVR
jgi:hypothetical protein